MSEITTPRRRRRRSDADRSTCAILLAAKELLAARPNASFEDIAAAAGVSRQTVYAHFKTREALVGAVIDVINANPATCQGYLRLVVPRRQRRDRTKGEVHVNCPTCPADRPTSTTGTCMASTTAISTDQYAEH